MKNKIYPIDEAPIDELIVLFEQYGSPFVGWINERGDFKTEDDLLEDHYDDDDIVGYLPLPTVRNNDWTRLIDD
jgi:hypothetical protein